MPSWRDLVQRAFRQPRREARLARFSRFFPVELLEDRRIPSIGLTEYSIPTPNSAPLGIVNGPDGALWITENATNKIGRVATDGTVTQFSSGPPQSIGQQIAAGSDGALWFTENAHPKLGRITTAGATSEYSLAGGGGANPQGITGGPDGGIWLVASGTNQIVRYSTAGAVTAQYAIPTSNSGLSQITTGADGALWFTESSANKIGRITTAGAISEFAVPTAGAQPLGIASGPDGALWFAESAVGRIGRITTAGAFSEYVIGAPGAAPQMIVAGADGALWFTDAGANAIGRVTTTGVVSEYAVPTANAGLAGIASGADQAVWFTETTGNKVGRAVFDLPLAAVGAGISATEGANFNGLVATFTDPDGSATAAGFSAVINWGDGGTSSGTVTLSGGRFSTSGSHRYADEGSYAVSVTITDLGSSRDPGGSTAIASSTATVADAALSGSGITFNAAQGQGFSAAVASFTDANPGAVASEFTATIDWGDGRTSAGTIAANGSGGFDVSGSNTYAAVGDYLVNVAIADTGGASTSIASLAHVTQLQVTAASISPTEAASFLDVVGSFTNVGNTTDGPGFYTAIIFWGDGWISGGSITQTAPGAFSVTGTHTYADEGTYTTTLLVHWLRGGGQTAADNGTATVADAPLSAVGQPFSAVEGALFSGPVAHFTDLSSGEPLSTYSATIHWGDGSSSAGVISASAGGGYDVSGSHRYAQAGSYAASTDIRDVGGASTSAAATATITDAPLTSTGALTTLNVTEGLDTGTQVVAAFSDPAGNGSTAIYSATINWGDGQTSAGSIAWSGGSGYTVSARHTYADEGRYTTTVVVQDSGGAAVTCNNTSFQVPDAPLTSIGATVTLAGLEGASTGNQVVVSFTDGNPGGSVSDFSATIAWGDGQTSTGTIASGGGGFQVIGTHTFGEEGTFGVTVTIRDVGGASVTATNTAFQISDAPLTASAATFAAVEQAPFTAVVASFTDADPGGMLTDYTATIQWGDGSSSTGTIAANGSGGFDVRGSHTYAEERTYSVLVRVLDQGGASSSATSMATVADAPLAGTTVSFNATEGQPFTGTVATFTDPGTDGSTADYVASIDWGDGQVSTGTVTALGGNRFAVAGATTYAEEGSYSVIVSIQDGGGNSARVVSAATVADAPLTAIANALAGVEGSALAGTVSTFTDANPGAAATDFTATVDWGDGHTSAGGVARTGPGQFLVTGANTYAEEGSYTVTVTIQDVGGSRAVSSATAAIADAALTPSGRTVTPVEAAPFSGMVATFTDADPNGTVSDYSATIDWGDGHTTQGVVSANGAAGFGVSGANTYAQEGSYTITVSIRDAGGSAAVVASRAVVADAPLSGTGLSISAIEQAPFAGVVALFQDPGTNGNLGDYSAVIDWGDGITSSGTVSVQNTSFGVSGAHTYAAVGPFTISVRIQDVGGAWVQVSSSVNVADAAITILARPIAALEQQRFSGIIAQFDDAGGNGTTAGYTATVDWGDGHTTAGSIVANGSGGFDVLGANTYAEEGSYTLRVSVRDGGGASDSAVGSATVADAPLSAAGQSITALETAPFSGIVATFTDPGWDGTLADYSAVIDWGDGHTTTGGIARNAGGGFDVSGTSVYAEEGSYSIQVVINDAGGASATAQSVATVADAPLSVRGMALSGVEGAALVGNVAVFNDAGTSGDTADYRAAIDWGDGTSSAGAISTGPSGEFTVSVSHTYTHAGRFQYSVLVTDQGGGTGQASGTADVVDAPLSLTATPFASREGITFSGIVASFADANPNALVRDFTATIDWGDGQTSSGVVSADATGFHIGGSHTYPRDGAYTVQIAALDRGGASASTSVTVQVGDVPPSVAGQTISAVEGQTFSGVVGVFADPSAVGAGEFSVVIQWGDWNTSAGSVIARPDGTFAIVATHTYARQGSYAINLSVTDGSGSAGLGTANATVADVAPFVQGAAIQATEGTLYSGAVGSFTDPSGTIDDFRALVDWGDGQQSAGVIQLTTAGKFAVAGSHLYLHAGSYAVTVTVTDEAGAVAIGASTATVSPALLTAQGSSLASTIGALSTGVVATFTDANQASLAADFSAVVDWGDGTTTPASVTGQDGVFQVSADYRYQRRGQYTLRVSIHEQGGGTVVADTVLNVSALPLSASGTVVNSTTDMTANGVLAVFRDPNPDGGGYRAVISWGDGQTATGTILPEGNGVYRVTGSYRFETDGVYPVHVSIRDAGGLESNVIATIIVTNASAPAPTPTKPASVAVTTFPPPLTAPAADLGIVVTKKQDNPYSPPFLPEIDDESPRPAARVHALPTVTFGDTAPAREPAPAPAATAPRLPTAAVDQVFGRKAPPGLNTRLLWGELDSMNYMMDTRALGVKEVAFGVGMVASAGYVVWALRNTYFLASLVAATPLWRQFDPLAVLDLWDGKKRPRRVAAGKKDEEDDSLESLVERARRRLEPPAAMGMQP